MRTGNVMIGAVKSKKIEYNKEAQNLLKDLQLNDRSIKDLKKVTVSVTPSGNWVIFHKGHRVLTLQDRFLSPETIERYGLR